MSSIHRDAEGEILHQPVCYNKLNAYTIYADEWRRVPDALNNHVTHMIKAARDHGSPTAKSIARKQLRAIFLDEQGGI